MLQNAGSFLYRKPVSTSYDAMRVEMGIYLSPRENVCHLHVVVVYQQGTLLKDKIMIHLSVSKNGGLKLLFYS